MEELSYLKRALSLQLIPIDPREVSQLNPRVLGQTINVLLPDVFLKTAAAHSTLTAHLGSIREHTH
jgi:hypothetical protein